MKKALIIFGSKADEKVYNQVASSLKKQKIDFDLRISSAHKTPDDVNDTLKNNYSVVIAGAGLAAHLPGVIASKVICPVIGVPCEGNYHGLDALLAIAQMPPGIPVLAVGVSQARIAAENCAKMMKKYGDVLLIGDEKIKAVQKAVEILKKFNVKFYFALNPNKDSINIQFTYFDEPIESKDELVIYCPLLVEENDAPESALNFLKHTSHGLWVGVNNGTNAALAAVEILNFDGSHSRNLLDYRKEIGEKVLEANK